MFPVLAICAATQNLKKPSRIHRIDCKVSKISQFQFLLEKLQNNVGYE